MLEIKNVSGVDIEIDNLVQVDQDTTNADDGKILIAQTLDILKSFTLHSMSNSEDLSGYIHDGSIVFVVNSVEQTAQQSKDFWDLGETLWAITTQPTSLAHLKTSTEFQEAVRDALQNLTLLDRLDASAIKNLV